jgi:hypothetical protein
MSSAFSKGQRREGRDKQISAARISSTSKGLNRSAAATRVKSHRATFRKG